MLDDRIRVFEDRPQRYGTQHDWAEDGTHMIPTGGVEDAARIDELRREVGLGPMQWRRPPPPDEPPPRDQAERRKRMAEWARSVGWRR
jgi:hypothetical protein